MQAPPTLLGPCWFFRKRGALGLVSQWSIQLQGHMVHLPVIIQDRQRDDRGDKRCVCGTGWGWAPVRVSPGQAAAGSASVRPS